MDSIIKHLESFGVHVQRYDSYQDQSGERNYTVDFEYFMIPGDISASGDSISDFRNQVLRKITEYKEMKLRLVRELKSNCSAYGAKFSSIKVNTLHGERMWRIDFTFNGKEHYKYVRDYEDLFNDLIIDLMMISQDLYG